MKINLVESWIVSMSLAEPYSIAYASVEQAENVFLRLETDSGLTGFGCAAPDQEVTGETPAWILAVLTDIAAPLLKGADPLARGPVLERIRQAVPAGRALLAAVDLALADLAGKAAGRPLYQLMGGCFRTVETFVTIGIMPEQEAVDRALGLLATGFKRLKIKGGLDLEADIARVRKLREAVGRDVFLLFDANQGYTVEETLAFTQQTREADLLSIEQPTPKEKPELLGQASVVSNVPVMADESLITLEDARLLARGNLVDLFNIKLMKVGGLLEAAAVDDVARAAGIKCLVGCMDEAALAIAAGLHFTLARPNVIYADLDGHLDLQGDPTAGAVRLEDGCLLPTEGPGLGWDPK